MVRRPGQAQRWEKRESWRSVMFIALKNFRRSIQLNPDYTLAYKLTADICVKLGRFRDAEIFYKEALIKDPNNNTIRDSLNKVQEKLTR